MNRFRSLVVAAAIALSALPGAASAQSTKWIDIHNKTSSTIKYVYFSEPTSRASWGSDFLGVDHIYPDQKYRFNVRSQVCMIDLKVVSTTGASQTLRFNICSAQHIDIEPNGLVVAF